MKDNILEKQRRAEQKLKELKDFYHHLMVYVVVNLFISIAKIVSNINNGETFLDAFWDFSTFAVWFFWGIGVIGHAAKVFSFNLFFNKDWEEQQIKKYMEEEARAEGKHKS